MLGNIGIGGLDLIPEFADGHFLVLQEAENLQAEGMGHGFKQAGNFVYIVVIHGFAIEEEEFRSR